MDGFGYETFEEDVFKFLKASIKKYSLEKNNDNPAYIPQVNVFLSNDFVLLEISNVLSFPIPEVYFRISFIKEDQLIKLSKPNFLDEFSDRRKKQKCNEMLDFHTAKLRKPNCGSTSNSFNMSLERLNDVFLHCYSEVLEGKLTGEMYVEWEEYVRRNFDFSARRTLKLPSYWEYKLKN